ncbi:MAG: ATP-binding protein, partial [Rhodovibrionaceae bacterium]
HELRTPLSSLLGFIETLRGPAAEDAEAQQRFLGIMEEQATRMSRLVEDLLSLSHIEMQEHSPPKGETDLGEVLRAVCEGLNIKARAKEMTLRLDIEGSPRVIGQKDELAQVFQNLIDNALKYGREGTEVTVTARAGGEAARLPGPSAVVAVRDRGEGISREHLPRLTERFYRVDTARSRKLGGTGLGLAIVKHIVNRHRGQLMIDSQPGSGSTFTVHLPAPPGAAL